MFNIHAGKTSSEALILLKILENALLGRMKSLPQCTLIAFVKRISSLALFLEHNGALGMLSAIRTAMQLGKGVQVLLDVDNEGGNGIYMPEIEDPEYSNAHCTTMWEIVALQVLNFRVFLKAESIILVKVFSCTFFIVFQRHYHSTVRNFARNVAWGVPTSGENCVPLEISKL